MGGQGNSGRRYLPLALLGTSVLLALFLACGEPEPPPPPPPPPPTITVNPPSITFIAEQTGGNPAAQGLTVSTSGDSLADHAVSADANWLTVEQTSSSPTTLTLQVGALASELGIGRYNGTVTVSVPDASNSPQTVPVELTISPHVEEYQESLHLDPFRLSARSFVFEMENHEEIHITWQATGQRANIYASLTAPDGKPYQGVPTRIGGPIDSFTPTAWPGISGGNACDDRGDVTLYCSDTYDRPGQKRLLPPGRYVLMLEIFEEAPSPWHFKSSSQVDIDVKYRIESVSG